VEPPPPPRTLRSQDALKTYRYLRVGMIGAVVLLAASILYERSKVDCWQTSISAYYYTPVRAVFVGGMIAVGLSLIIIKGRTWIEDNALNLAGMLAPVVAVAPTTDVGRCWSIQPEPLPIKPDGTLATWVEANVSNNFAALLLVGAVGLVLAGVLSILVHRGVFRDEALDPFTWWSLALTGGALALAWWLFARWDAFYTRAHGFAAVGMFVFLIVAVASKAWEHRQRSADWYVAVYGAVAVLMTVGGVAIAVLRIGGEHTVFVLEAYEIALFAAFWMVQTGENWNERTVES
jgi:hypothetical protein